MYSPPRRRRDSPSYDNGPSRDRERDRERERDRDRPPRPPSPPLDPTELVLKSLDSENRSIFVSQLASRLTSQDLGMFFEDKLGRGAVRDARVVTDRQSKRSKG